MVWLPHSCVKQTRREHFQTLVMRVLLEWVIEDFTKSELQQSWRTVVLDLQKVPLQGSYSVPTGLLNCFIETLREELFSQSHQFRGQCLVPFHQIIPVLLIVGLDPQRVSENFVGHDIEGHLGDIEPVMAPQNRVS